MITKVTHGRRVDGLLRYLYGPGRFNEHHDPHLVAGFDEIDDLEPTVGEDGRRDFRRLVDLLEGPLAAIADGPREPVWHCSMRAGPEDPVLTDEQWAHAASEVLHRTGYARRDDSEGCRWVAIRHADDHIHIVVTLARQDGRLPVRHNDYLNARKAAQAIEERFGLTRTARADRTAPRRARRGEAEKALRAGRPEPPRTTLRREVQLAAVTAASEDDFFRLLSEAGLKVRRRFSTLRPDEVTGYAVALSDDRYPDGTPVYRSGGKLAADLSLPRLRQRWSQQSGTGPERPSRVTGPADPLSAEQRRQLWRDVAREAAAATGRIRHIAETDPMAAADTAHATADILTVAARTIEGSGGGPLTEAADGFDRAGRELGGRIPPATPRGQALRMAARTLTLAGVIGDRDTTRMLALVVQLAALADAVAELRTAQQRSVQAAAARQASTQLHEVIHGGDRHPDLGPVVTSAIRRPAPSPARHVRHR